MRFLSVFNFVVTSNFHVIRHVLMSFDKKPLVGLKLPNFSFNTILQLGAVTMLFLLVFKFIVGLYIACFNGQRFVTVTFFSAEYRDMRCFYVL